MKLPEEFCDRMRAMLKTEYDSFMASYEAGSHRSLRVNTLKDSVGAFVDRYSRRFGLEPVPWEETGFYYDEVSRPGRHPLHRAGAFYIQEASAMAPVALGEVREGEKVLDLCAAPGGKSTQIACRLGGTGLLVANEIVTSRARILSGNIERMGVTNALVTSESPEKFEGVFEDVFDAVFVDAPCSGEGMFRKDEEAVSQWSPGQVAACARRQSLILDSARKMTAPGGRIIYSTCTFAPEEDELMIASFLSDHPDFSLERPRKAGMFSPGLTGEIGAPEGMADCVRVFPHRNRGEGHFIAVLRKEEGKRRPARPMAFDHDRKKAVLWKDFASEYLKGGRGFDPVSFGDRLLSVPSGMVRADRTRILRCGLELGEVKKDRFEPSHSLAVALKPEEFSNCELLSPEDDRCTAFLSGEEIPAVTASKGWCLICVDGYSLAFGKCDGRTIKNHYPKGLRIQKA